MLIGIALLMTFLGSLGAFFLKKSTGGSLGLRALLCNRFLYLGGVFYVAGALLNIALLHRMEYSVIIATGASAKYLGLADEEKYRGQGVSACATCDGFFYRKRTVAVVGGGDTACEEAMYLSGLAKKVYMIVRKPYLRASEIMQQRVKNKENIEILFETNTLGLFGENGVEGAHLVRHKGEANEEKFDISIDGFFLAIGHKPNTDLFKGQIDLDEQGFIKVVPGTATTNIPGVFAAGDVADPIYRQGVVAAGSGAKAAIEADRFLQQQ